MPADAGPISVLTFPWARLSSSQTAPWELERLPSANPMPMHLIHSGMLIYTQAELDELVRLAAEANLQTAVHAIGDGALEMVLRSYERAKALIPCWTVRPGSSTVRSQAGSSLGEWLL